MTDGLGLGRVPPPELFDALGLAIATYRLASAMRMLATVKTSTRLCSLVFAMACRSSADAVMFDVAASVSRISLSPCVLIFFKQRCAQLGRRVLVLETLRVGGPVFRIPRHVKVKDDRVGRKFFKVGDHR